jgi:hypothetical protein
MNQRKVLYQMSHPCGKLRVITPASPKGVLRHSFPLRAAEYFAVISTRSIIFTTFFRVKCAFVGVLMVVSLGTTERSQASDVSQPYNFLLGPVSLNTNSSLITSFNDNINLSKTGRQVDFIINPSAGIDALWKVSEENNLTFSVGVGYEWYVLHPQNDGLTISPNSQALFKMSVGDIKISLHDDFSYQQDPLLVAQLSNSSKFPVFSNDAGIGLSWDLNDVALSLGYDHTNQWVFDNAFNYLDSQEDALSPQLTVKIGPAISAGISMSLSDTRFDKNVQNDSTSISAGPFVTAQLSKNLSVNAQVGYVMENYASGGSNGDNENVNSYYGSVGVSHQINEYFTQSIVAGRDYIPGLTSNFTQQTYVNYTIGWQATSYISLSSNLSAENLDDSDATVRENSNRYGAGLSLDYAATTHTNISLSYQYTLKDSDASSLGYYQNLITAGFSYQF